MLVYRLQRWPTLKRVVLPAVFAAITEHRGPMPGVSQSSIVFTRAQRQHIVGY